MGGRRAMTLLELILVLGLLTMFVTMAAPALGRFFAGRSQLEEARRLVALARFARVEAIERAARAELWLEPEEGLFGLTLTGPPLGVDEPERIYELNERFDLRVYDDAGEAVEGRTAIVFTPEGAIEAQSPFDLAIRDKDGYELPIERREDGLGFVLGEGRQEDEV